jgi:hypothetical protein
MANSSDIQNALMAKLGSDAELLALCPNGVYRDQAPPGASRFVIVSLLAGEDTGVFGKRAIEAGVYLVEARMLSTIAGANVNAAAARIDVLLEGQPLTVTGFAWMTLHREEPIGLTEVDASDPSIRWFRRGGRYRLEMSHAAA